MARGDRSSLGHQPSWALAGVVAADLAVALALASRHRWPSPGGAAGTSDPNAYGWLALLLFVPYGLAALASARSGAPASRWLWIAAAAAGGAYLMLPPIQSHDVFQYLMYGRLQALHHANPYSLPPSAFPADPWTTLLGWPRQLSVYGPVWLLAMRGVVTLARETFVPSVVLAKATAWGSVLLAGWALMRLGGEATSVGAASGDRGSRGRLWFLLFVLNPLVVWSSALGGHADATLAAAVALAMLLDRQERPGLAALALAVAALVKAWAVLPLAVYAWAQLRRKGPWSAATTLAGPLLLVVLTSAPFWAGPAILAPLVDIGLHTSSSLAGAIQEALAAILASAGVRSAETIATSTIHALAAGALVTTAGVLAFRRRTVEDPWHAACVLTGVFILVSPWFLPWYAVAPLSLALPVGGAPSGAALALTASGIFGDPVLRYGPPLLAWTTAHHLRPTDRRAQSRDPIEWPT